MESTIRSPITLLAACLTTLASLSALARSPASVADSLSIGSGPPANASPQARTLPAPWDQTSPPAPGQPARFERISAADGLSFPRVHAILQDHQGFMWFATMHGLNRYDGHKFTVYNHDPGDPTSIRNDDVDTVFEDSDGVLWVEEIAQLLT